MMRQWIPVLFVSLVLVACGDDADKPAVGSNNANNVATNNATTNNATTNNATTNNLATNNATTNNATTNNATTPLECGAPNTDPTLELAEAVAPRGYEGVDGLTFYQGISYGPDQLNAFDIFVPESTEPTPLIIYIHGGGFTGGQRQSGYSNVQRTTTFLEAGVAYASISYRLLLPEGETEGVIKSMTDSRRALQFIRMHAADFNVDPDRIALAGGSAGAGTSLWIGLGDEACSPESNDPVEQMSTRVQGIAAIETQATYDLKRWDTDVYGEDFPLVTLQNAVALDPGLYSVIGQFYGLPGDWMNLADLEEEPLVSYRAEVDMLALPDPTDPPLYVWNNGPSSMPSDLGSLLHHPLHAEAIYDAAVAGGVERAELQTIDREERTAENWGAFLIEVLSE